MPVIRLFLYCWGFSMVRAEWGSRLGFVLAAAGSAVGLGAIWKFPYVTAKNGGGAFLLIFLVIVCTLGFSLMIAEMAVGAASRKSPVGAYRRLGGKKWSLVGYIGVLCGFLILSFYSVVGGWTIAYMVKSMEGTILTAEPKVLSKAFDTFITDPVVPLWYHAAFMGMTAGVVLAGVQKGIERVSKYLMIMLFLLILVLIGRAVFSHMEGGRFFGILFFFLLFVAALTSSVSLMEVVVSFFIDEFHFPRTPTTVVMALLMFGLGIAASLSLGVWQGYTLFGKNFFGLLDYISSNLIMPFGGIMVSILVGWKAWPAIVAKLGRPDGTQPVWLPLLKGFCRYVAPVLIGIILFQNL